MAGSLIQIATNTVSGTSTNSIDLVAFFLFTITSYSIFIMQS